MTTLNKDGTPRKKHKKGAGRPKAKTVRIVVYPKKTTVKKMKSECRKDETLGQMLDRKFTTPLTQTER